MQNKFLMEGKQTKITERVTRLASDIDGMNIDFINNALLWIHSNLDKIPKGIEKNSIFRKRTVKDILSDGYLSGCTDYALVFISLCKAKGIPTKYIETIKRDWLESKNTSAISGHVFAECYINNRWIQVDPQKGKVYVKRNYNGYKIYREGLDSWDIGITDFGSLKKKFESFKENYRNQQ